MGFWDKVKSVKNMVTGGAADMEVMLPDERSLGEPFIVRISAIMKGDLNISKVYLKIRAMEYIEADGVEIEYEHGEQEIEREIVRKSTETFHQDYNVSGPEELEEGETYTWEYEVVLSDDLNGTYQGVHALHQWEIYAGLDAMGNDPDTGWRTFEIY